MLIAAQYWPGKVVAGIGAVYLLGRFVCWRAYLADPARRSIGFAFTVLPTFALVGLGIYGAFFAEIRRPSAPIPPLAWRLTSPMMGMSRASSAVAHL